MWKIEKSITFCILIIVTLMISPIISIILVSIVAFTIISKIKEQNEELLKQNEKIIKLLDDEYGNNNDQK